MAGTTGQTVAGLGAQIQGLLSTPGIQNALGTAAGGGGAAPAAGGTPGAMTTAAPAAGGIGVDGASQPLKIPGTGKLEKRIVEGKVRYFEAAPVGGVANEISAFKYINALRLDIPIDYRPGLATGLANLSNVFNARSERTRLLSAALAEDADSRGSIDQVDLMRMQMETTTTEQLSQIQAKIFESMKNSIAVWLR